MIIRNANINLQQQHQKISRTEERESLNFWVGQRSESPNSNASDSPQPQFNPATQTTLSKAATHQPHKEQHALDEMKLGPQDELRMQIISRMVEAITGHKFELFDPAKLTQDIATSELGIMNSNPEAPVADSAGFGLEYDYYASHYEYESLSFSAEGNVTTSDGRTIAFTAQLNMQREFLQEQSISIRAGDAVKIDPLVLNFNGTGAELQDTFFEFDLDADGRTEQIALLAPGNAYLALDKNQDDKINDGSELFGPANGKGFLELARYDEDGNQFIDEADSIYSKLRLWSRDANGQEHLIGLGDSGVGAIYLGHLNTAFELQQNQQTLGDLASSGVYLNEDGSTGLIQQIDLRA